MGSDTVRPILKATFDVQMPSAETYFFFFFFETEIMFFLSAGDQIQGLTPDR